MTVTPPSCDPNSAIVLTQLDVDRLLADPSPESRMHVLERVYRHYSNNEFGGREHAVAEQIFRLLMKDVVIAVREALARHIQDNPAIPRDIVLHVANDIESVAVPILTHSTVLSDADLIGIIEANKDLSKLLAITQRSIISARVSDALVEVNHPDVLGSLVQNAGAEITAHTYEKIVTGFRSDKNVMQALVDRASLPIHIVERLVHEAGAAIAIQLKTKYQLSDKQLQKNTAGAHDDVLLYLLSHRVSEEEMVALVAQMQLDHRLTPTLVMKGLCRGQLAFFTASLACLSGVSIKNTTLLLSDRGGLGFRGIYGKAGLPESMMQAALLVWQGVQALADDDIVPGSQLYANRLAEYVLQAVGNDNVLHLPHFIALIRQPIQPH